MHRQKWRMQIFIIDYFIYIQKPPVARHFELFFPQKDVDRLFIRRVLQKTMILLLEILVSVHRQWKRHELKARESNTLLFGDKPVALCVLLISFFFPMYIFYEYRNPGGIPWARVELIMLPSSTFKGSNRPGIVEGMVTTVHSITVTQSFYGLLMKD